MRRNYDGGRNLDSVMLLFMVGLLLFFSPFTFWWAAAADVWYLPYLLWLALIALIAWSARGRHHDV